MSVQFLLCGIKKPVDFWTQYTMKLYLNLKWKLNLSGFGMSTYKEERNIGVFHPTIISSNSLQKEMGRRVKKST